MEKQPKLVLVDGHAMLYRAWFAFPKSLTTRKGELINAAYGFTRILLKVIEEMEPEYLAVTFDVGKTFRHEMYPEYKAHREKMPEELKVQEPLVDRVLNALNIPIIAKEGYEADDVIGSLARQAVSHKEQVTSNRIEVVVVTGDKDVLQLVADPSADSTGSLRTGSGRVRVYMPARAGKPAIVYDEAAVKVDLGVTPIQIPDYKGLAGDSSDNIPGVRGVGPKTAVKLLTKFGNIEKLYEVLAKGEEQLMAVVKPAMVDKLKQGEAMARESKKLATIIRDVPIKLDLAACAVKAYDKQQATAVFEEMEFQSLLSKLPKDEFETMVQEALF